MVASAIDGIDLFKIAGRSISGWIPRLKTDTVFPLRQPFCSQLEECLLLWLEYHPHVVSYAHGDIGPVFAKTYRLPSSKDTPFYTLKPQGGFLRFKSHDERKTRTPNTDQQWVRRETSWEFSGGEST